MTFPSGMDIARGLVPGCRSFFRFGRNTAIGATYTPVSRSGHYRTPQAGSATTLRLKAGGNANDTAAGSGARQITLVGLDAAGNVITETLATAGASASAATTKSFIRLTEAYVSASGTYASQSAGSHAGNITIENGSGGTDWALIADGTLGKGQAEIGSYTTPLNRSASVSNITISSDSDKKTNLVMFRRDNILETAAPYSPMTMIMEFPQNAGINEIILDPPLFFPQLTDFGFLAAVASSTVDVSVSMNITELIPR
jgi:hypothetical protein